MGQTQDENNIHDAIIRIFQEESRIVIAALLSTLCDIELAEDGLQDALVEALIQWQQRGIPPNPGGWIMTTARRKVIDRLRRNSTQQRYLPELDALNNFERQAEDEPDEIPDERLKLMFTCCHPALGQEIQVMLTLQTVARLSTEVIAQTFLLPVPTLAQRLVRAKRKIRDAGIPYQVPSTQVIGERLDAVLSVIYFIFNAGYKSHLGEQLIEADLCDEAIRLARTLHELLITRTTIGEHAETLGLISLMLLHHARRHARISADGDMVLLEAQERSLWDQQAIQEGIALLDHAITLRQRGVFQIQAAIVALHIQADKPSDTDWKQIALLYRSLLDFNPSPVIQLNHIVAMAMVEGIEKGLELLNAIAHKDELEEYYLYHATHADFLRRLNRFSEAKSAYEQAISLCKNQTEQRFLQKRLNEVSG
jgi:RNA polymerase sigma-70 factor, ECF subfamily